MNKNEEIKYLGQILTATRFKDLNRIQSVISRLKQIIFPENPTLEVVEIKVK